jgi:hypothetical protein
MSNIRTSSLNVPYTTPMVDANGLMTRAWSEFFRELRDRVDSLGFENVFTLTNNQSTLADIVGLTFGKAGVSKAVIEYLVQRVSSSSELIESGVMHAVYMPDSDDWELVVIGTPGPDDAGITFDITATGQVRYQTTNQAGTIELSRIAWRVLSFGVKSSTYSLPGANR